MLRLTVELVPFGIEEDARKIGEMLIANDGTGTHGYGNYGFVCTDNNSFARVGTLEKWNRSNPVWELIAECIKDPDTVMATELTDLLEERLRNA